MDISLRYVDINQCDAQNPSGLEEQTETGNEQTRLTTFMGTHRCKQSTEASHPKVQNINSHYWSLDAEIHRLEMIEIWIKWVKMMCKKEWCSVSKNNLKDPSSDEIPNGGKGHIQSYISREADFQSHLKHFCIYETKMSLARFKESFIFKWHLLRTSYLKIILKLLTEGNLQYIQWFY